MSSDDKTKIRIRGLTKVFGPRPESALKLLKQGTPKKEIFDHTGHAVGLDDVSFDVREGEITPPVKKMYLVCFIVIHPILIVLFSTNC